VGHAGCTDLYEASAAVVSGKLGSPGCQIALNKHGHNRPASDVLDHREQGLPDTASPVGKAADRRLSVHVAKPVQATAKNQRQTVGNDPDRLVDDRRVPTN